MVEVWTPFAKAQSSVDSKFIQNENWLITISTPSFLLYNLGAFPNVLVPPKKN